MVTRVGYHGYQSGLPWLPKWVTMVTMVTRVGCHGYYKSGNYNHKNILHTLPSQVVFSNTIRPLASGVVIVGQVILSQTGAVSFHLPCRVGYHGYQREAYHGYQRMGYHGYQRMGYQREGYHGYQRDGYHGYQRDGYHGYQREGYQGYHETPRT